MWLLGQLTPDNNTIANFRKNHAKAIGRIFRATAIMTRISRSSPWLAEIARCAKFPL